ncbi:MAG TPA: ATP-binding protein [Solirubrobacteraceae bacterium]|nr:ATP-binding protein [Solirubrobacteraceae bacterium]
MSDDRPLVHLRLLSTPETLTLVRGVLGALAELLALDPELLDDLKTAISEACNNVVLHAYGGEPGPLEVYLYVAADAIEAVICDEGVGIPETSDPEEGVHGVGLPLIKALTNGAVEFAERPGGGTAVRMTFAGRRDGHRLFTSPSSIAYEDGWVRRLEGEAVVSLSPVSFLGPVLGRLARALAARARFSLDRFSDVYLVTDALAAEVAGAASLPRVGFAITTEPRRLQIKLGPLKDGSGAAIAAAAKLPDAGSPLLMLSDHVRTLPDDAGELLEVVMTDDPDRSAAAV